MSCSRNLYRGNRFNWIFFKILLMCLYDFIFCNIRKVRNFCVFLFKEVLLSYMSIKFIIFRCIFVNKVDFFMELLLGFRVLVLSLDCGEIKIFLKCR